MGTNKTEKPTFWRSYANQLLLAGMVVVLAVFLTFVYRSDCADIANVADETLAFMRSVCQRYDDYATGRRTSQLKDVFDKTNGLARLADAADLSDTDYLCRFAKAQGLTGVLVTDASLQPVGQIDLDGNDAYALWGDFLRAENKRNIIKYKNKSYSGTVTLDGVEYRLAILSRQDAKGMILGYAACRTALTDVYETSLEKTLDNNTFHKNPRILVTDGTQILASNLAEYTTGMALSALPVQDTSGAIWSDSRLVKMKWSNGTWYGKRLAYKEYRIYVFYPAEEVFNNMLPVVTTAIAVYALLCLLLLVLRYRAERRYRLRDQEQLNTIKAISSLFVTTSILHLHSDAIEGIISTPRAQAVLDETTRAEDVARKLAERIIAPDYRDTYVSFLDFTTMDARLRGKTSVATVCRDVDGRWFSIYLIPMAYDADGRVRDVLFASRDINEYMQKQEEYQEKLRKTAHDAKLANEVKSSFLRRMSHDLRTPINGIRGMASMAEQSLDAPEQAREYIHKIIASSDYLKAILEDVLRMSKLESGTLSFEEKPYDLRKVVQETADFILERADESSVQCTIRTDGLVHDRVIGSPLHLRQIMQNILSNAVKFTPAGGKVEAVCEEVGCEDGVMQLRFTCRDTGIGMSEEFQQHIFEPFSQEDDSARSVFMGTGLGLPIAKEILDKRHGTIHIDSQKGVGTTVVVTLPLKLDETYCAQPLPAPQSAAIDGVRVLVVEDNEINMEIARYMLEGKGAVVTEARNGREALEQFRDAAPGTFDVILMDIMMPEMDGLEATRAIRALDRGDAATVPIFAMTANAFVDDINLSIDAGMNEHLSKPLNIDEVTAMIYRYCRKA